MHTAPRLVSRLISIFVSSLALAPIVIGQEPATLITERPSTDELTAAIAAKVLASGVFVSQREPDDVLEKNVHRMIGLFDYRPDDISMVEVDRDRGLVTVRIKDAPPRTARFYGDQGCVVLPSGASGVSFAPAKSRSAARDRSSEPWPTDACARWPSWRDRRRWATSRRPT